jgi:ketosteroid isomerase-like protein
VYAWAAGLFIRRAFAQLSVGRWEPSFRRFAHDALLRFPGDHALGGEFRGRAEIRAWFERAWGMFEIRIDVQDVVVSGWPGRQRVATRFTGRITAADGRVFHTRGMQFLRLRWGRVLEEELYEDTQVLAAATAHAAVLAADPARHD